MAGTSTCPACPDPKPGVHFSALINIFLLQSPAHVSFCPGKSPVRWSAAPLSCPVVMCDVFAAVSVFPTRLGPRVLYLSYLWLAGTNATFSRCLPGPQPEGCLPSPGTPRNIGPANEKTLPYYSCFFLHSLFLFIYLSLACPPQ